MTMHSTIRRYNAVLAAPHKRICAVLAKEIDAAFPKGESKVWHGSPVWFLDGNPVAGYGKVKDGVRLLFWSGQSFREPSLASEGSFKAAEARFGDAKEIVLKDLRRWLRKARLIQWDYKNIVKRKGKLVRIK